MPRRLVGSEKGLDIYRDGQNTHDMNSISSFVEVKSLFFKILNVCNSF